MEAAMVVGAFRLLASLSLPLLAAVIGGALIAGAFRVSTQIDDPSLGLAGRLFGFAVLLSMGAKWWLGDVINFASRLWGGGDIY